MIDDYERIAQRRRAFAEEAREDLLTLNLLLFVGEGQGFGNEALDRLFREAHHLKGAAAAVALEEVVSLLHELESQFSTWRAKGEAPTVREFDAAFALVHDIIQVLAGSGLTTADSSGNGDGRCCPRWGHGAWAPLAAVVEAENEAGADLPQVDRASP